MTSKLKISELAPSRNLSDLALLISDHITAMLAYWDKDLICRYANSAYVDWFGKTKEEMIDNISIDELLGPLYEKNLPFIKGVLLDKKQLFEREIPIPKVVESGIHLPLIFLIYIMERCSAFLYTSLM